MTDHIERGAGQDRVTGGSYDPPGWKAAKASVDDRVAKAAVERCEPPADGRSRFDMEMDDLESAALHCENSGLHRIAASVNGVRLRLMNLVVTASPAPERRMPSDAEIGQFLGEFHKPIKANDQLHVYAFPEGSFCEFVRAALAKWPAPTKVEWDRESDGTIKLGPHLPKVFDKAIEIFSLRLPSQSLGEFGVLFAKWVLDNVRPMGLPDAPPRRAALAKFSVSAKVDPTETALRDAVVEAALEWDGAPQGLEEHADRLFDAAAALRTHLSQSTCKECGRAK